MCYGTMKRQRHFVYKLILNFLKNNSDGKVMLTKDRLEININDRKAVQRLLCVFFLFITAVRMFIRLSLLDRTRVIVFEYSSF